MVKKIWFYLCIFQLLMILGLAFTILLPSLTSKDPQQFDSVEYLSQSDESDNYLPDAGYIPDAKTAIVVGSAVIDKMVGSGYSLINSTVVEYDTQNRVWLITRSYFPHHGGFVIIEQDSGKIVKALLTK